MSQADGKVIYFSKILLFLEKKLTKFIAKILPKRPTLTNKNEFLHQTVISKSEEACFQFSYAKRTHSLFALLNVFIYRFLVFFSFCVGRLNLFFESFVNPPPPFENCSKIQGEKYKKKYFSKVL